MLIFLLLALSLSSPAHGQSSPDYNNPYSPIITDKPVYSWTDKIQMTIISPSWNTNRHVIDSIGDADGHLIKITTTNHSLEPYRFTETDVNSGVFTAELILTGFTHDADGDGNNDTDPRTTGRGPTNGFLETDRDSAVTISFEFADGVTLIESVPVSWNTGTISFSKDHYLTGDVATVRVVDADMNLNPEVLDSLTVQVSSDSDMAGIKVSAVETSARSGLFIATVFLSQNSVSGGDQLYSLPGDEIFAKYDDHTLPKPFSKSDSLEITSLAQVDSLVPSALQIKNLELSFSDGLGNPLLSFLAGSQIQIVGTIQNDHDFKQGFVYLFQVKNEYGHTESLSWIQGEINPNQILDVSQSWLPKESGTYEIETFVWNSISNPLPLSPRMSSQVMIG